MPRPSKVTRTAVIRLKAPSWISQRDFVNQVNEILSSAAPGYWNRRHPRTDKYQYFGVERLRAGHPKRTEQ